MSGKKDVCFFFAMWHSTRICHEQVQYKLGLAVAELLKNRNTSVENMDPIPLFSSTQRQPVQHFSLNLERVCVVCAFQPISHHHSYSSPLCSYNDARLHPSNLDPRVFASLRERPRTFFVPSERSSALTATTIPHFGPHPSQTMP